MQRAPRLGRLTLPPLPPVFDAAVCREWDPQLWDSSVAGESVCDRIARWAAAATICSQCPCRAACVRVAEREPLATGVWGGIVFHSEATGEVSSEVTRGLRTVSEAR